MRRSDVSLVSAETAVSVAFDTLNTIQKYDPADAVAGLFLLAYVVAQQRGLDVSELMNQSQRRFDDANTFFKREAQAISDYVNGEMR